MTDTVNTSTGHAPISPDDDRRVIDEYLAIAKELMPGTELSFNTIDVKDLTMHERYAVAESLRRFRAAEPAPCPHVRTSRGGTSYCELAEFGPRPTDEATPTQPPEPPRCPTCGDDTEGATICSNPWHLLKAGYTIRDGYVSTPAGGGNENLSGADEQIDRLISRMIATTYHGDNWHADFRDDVLAIVRVARGENATPQKHGASDE